MEKIERQLRLYELVCGYAITSFEAIEEEFPNSGRRMIQRDLRDLKDAGLVSVNYVRKAQGYVKEKQRPKFNEDTEPRRKAHLKRLNRIGRLMSELYNEDIPRKKTTKRMEMSGIMCRPKIPIMNCFRACRSGRDRGILKSFAGLVIRFFMITGSIASVRGNSIWAGRKRRR